MSLSAMMIAGCTGEVDSYEQVKQNLLQQGLSNGEVNEADLDNWDSPKTQQSGVVVDENENLVRIDVPLSAKSTYNVVTQEAIAVYPTGVARRDLAPEDRCPAVDCTPTDAQLIQAAVDDLGTRGVSGIIVLKAVNLAGTPMAFNFGNGFNGPNNENVCIYDTQTSGYCRHVQTVGQSGDLELRGETLATGEQSTVDGGYFAFHFGRNASLTVKNLVFTGFIYSAVTVAKTTGLEIKNNKFYPFYSSQITGIIGVGNWGFGGMATTGHAVIKDNYIDGSYGHPANAFEATAIYTINHNMTGEIKNNTVLNTGYGPRVQYYRKNWEIKNNVVMGVYVGVFVGCDVTDLGTSQLSVQENNISTLDTGMIIIAQQGKNNGAQCPVVNSSFNNNKITLAGPNITPAFLLGGINFDPNDPGVVAHNEFKENTILGSSDYVFMLGYKELYGWFGYEVYENVYDNTIENNNLSDFVLLPTPLWYGWPISEAHVFFNSTAHNNAYIGKVGEVVIDNGTNNTVVLLP